MLSPSALNIWSLKIPLKSYSLRTGIAARSCSYRSKFDPSIKILVTLNTHSDLVEVRLGTGADNFISLALVTVSRIYHTDRRTWLDCTSCTNHISDEPVIDLRIMAECCIAAAKISKTLNKLELYHA